MHSFYCIDSLHVMNCRGQECAKSTLALRANNNNNNSIYIAPFQHPLQSHLQKIG